MIDLRGNRAVLILCLVGRDLSRPRWRFLCSLRFAARTRLRRSRVPQVPAGLDTLAEQPAKLGILLGDQGQGELDRSGNSAALVPLAFHAPTPLDRPGGRL